MRNKILGCLFILIFVFGIVIGEIAYTQKIMNSPLIFLGMQPYYSIGPRKVITAGLFFLALVIIGFLGARHFLKDVYPQITNNLIFILILFVLLFPMIKNIYLYK
ncbi:hypothetical protein [Thermosyntropha sp.]|uniref:hypothetical protein n=1 Tax=Thermosyntropha sp. TaxID=2740820 RepID=UPI0025D55560|nr:hypothetical protein [Thermosyntropha sp.]MBO8158931.1 hypothetical protein [Thermosyntropha sp.]